MKFKFELEADDFHCLRAASIVAYTSLAEESGGVVSAPMQMIRDTVHRLEEQYYAQAPDQEQEPAAENVPEGESVLVLGDKALD